MAITFIKPARFDSKDVKDITFDIDANWMVKNLSFAASTNDNNLECIDYTFILHSKKLNEDSGTTRITIRNYKNQRTRNLPCIEYHIRGINQNFYHSFTRQKIYQRNIYLLLCNLVKDMEFIKGVFQMKRCTQRETIKKFGRVFERR